MTLFCCDENRRRLVRDAADPLINGIDFVEVLDADLASSDTLRQRTLLLHFIKPLVMPLAASLSTDQVLILGGERVINPPLEWAELATPMPPQLDPTAHPDEKGVHDRVAALLNPDRVLVLRCAERGDFSSYLLRLRKGSTEDSPPDHLDPRLAEVSFRFKVECVSDFDCRQELVCPPPAQASAAIDYLARDYPSLRRLVLDRLSLLLPGWRERSEADLMVVLAELIAYLGDQFSYQLDAIGTEAYLDTARLRTSLRRHALLVDYPLHDGCNARVWLHLPTRSDAAATGVVLPSQPLRFYTRLPDLPRLIQPGSRTDQLALAAAPVVFESIPEQGTTLFAAHNRIELHTWGDARCCLPAGSTSASLRGHLPTLKSGDLLLFEEIKGPLTGAAADADPNHRHVVRLTEVRALIDPLPQPLAITEVRWAPADALPFPLCVSSLSETGALIPGVSVARGNILLADHGLSLAPEPLGTVPASRLNHPPERDKASCAPRERQPIPVRFRPALARGPLTCAAPPPTPASPAALALRSSPEEARPALRLESRPAGAPEAEAQIWTTVADLLRNSGPDARHVVVETEHDGSVRLRFGDDSYGRRPTQGSVFRALARIGHPLDGNVGAETIAHLVGDDPALSQLDVAGLRNPLPAVGGVAPEQAAQLRRRAPQAFRRQERAVTPEDYAAMAERFAGVQRASARLRWTGSWYTVFLTVDRLGGAAMDRPFAAALLRHLETYRMAAVDLEIEEPLLAPLELALHICVKPGHQRAQVRAALVRALGAQRLPEGGLGYFHPDRWSFGQTVYVSGIEAAARAVAGVATAQATSFQRQGKKDPVPLQKGYLSLGAREIVRLDNDRNHPDRGVLRLDLHGGN